MDRETLEELTDEGCHRCGRVCAGTLDIPAQRPQSLELLNRALRKGWLGQWPSGKNSAKEIMLVILARALKDPDMIQVKDGLILVNNAELGAEPTLEQVGAGLQDPKIPSPTLALINFVRTIPRAGGAAYEGFSPDAIAEQLYDDAWAALYAVATGTWTPGEYGPTCPTCLPAMTLPETGEVPALGTTQVWEGCFEQQARSAADVRQCSACGSRLTPDGKPLVQG